MSLKAMKNGAAHLLVKRYIGPFWKHRKWLNETQWLTKKQLQQIQLNLLKRLILHSYNSVPFYRRLMDQRNLNPDSIKKLNDIKKLPIISKEDVLKAADSIISKKYPKLFLRKARTGGSTGTPLIIHRNIASLGTEHAFVRRQWDWARVGFRDKTAHIFQRVVVKPDKKSHPLYEYDPIMKELTLSAYHCSPETAVDYAKTIKKYGIEVLVGYPSAIYLMAKTCLSSGFDLKLRVVLSTWEAMTENIRNTITQAFGCKIFDFYGSGERVVTIHKCKHGTYHIIPEYGLTELIPLDGHKNRYKIVATGFWNMATPLIRYDIGDIVEKTDTSCTCKRQFDTVKSIIGKQGDVIKTPSGIELGATAITQILYVIGGTNNILRTQIIQDSLDHITIEYVPADNFTEKDLINMKKCTSSYLPAELKVELKQVKDVRKTPMGKIRPIISLLKDNSNKNLQIFKAGSDVDIEKQYKILKKQPL